MKTIQHHAAFPFQERPDSALQPEYGLTKREYFAGLALSVWQIEGNDFYRLLNGAPPAHDIVAKFCVGLADALIAELNKERP